MGSRVLAEESSSVVTLLRVDDVVKIENSMT